MKQSTVLPWAALLLVAGCSARPKPPVAADPFVFKALDLQQQDQRGRPTWELRSPEARYDLTRQLAQARQPRGVIYKRGKPQIRIAAQSGTVIADGQAIQLEGDVRITLLGRNPVEITGDQVRWIPSEQLMAIDRRPIASDRRSRIRAEHARYFLDRDLVELRGSPQLEHWNQDQSGAKAGEQRPQAAFRLQSGPVDWRPEQGDLRAPGPVRGERFGAERNQPKHVQLLLTSTGLAGNLREGFVDLQAPVLVRDLRRSGWLQARTIRWAINDQLLTTTSPFAGRFKRLKARGEGFAVNLAESTITVTARCLVEQPGERLQADRCLWQWPTGRFLATGAVRLQRQAYRQITQATQLRGRIGSNGIAVFTAPGAKVRSQFTLPKQEPHRSTARRAAPVRF